MPTLKAYPREEKGSAPARRLRKEGWIPAVLYGKSVQNRLLKVEHRALREAIQQYYQEPGPMTLEVEGNGRYSVLVREIQHDPLRGTIRHVDFWAVDPHEVVEEVVEIVPAEGPVVRGVHLMRRKLRLRGPAEKLPHVLRLPLSHLHEGQKLLVRDIEVPEGLQILDPPGDLVARRP